MIKARTAKFQIGQIVRHRVFSFRGVIFDIDPEFNNTEEWWLSIPEELRPHKDQPFYHLLAENSESEYVAYVSEQNLLPDDTGELIRLTCSPDGAKRNPGSARHLYRIRFASSGLPASSERKRRPNRAPFCLSISFYLAAGLA